MRDGMSDQEAVATMRIMEWGLKDQGCERILLAEPHLSADEVLTALDEGGSAVLVLSKDVTNRLKQARFGLSIRKRRLWNLGVALHR